MATGRNEEKWTGVKCEDAADADPYRGVGEIGAVIEELMQDMGTQELSCGLTRAFGVRSAGI